MRFYSPMPGCRELSRDLVASCITACTTTAVAAVAAAIDRDYFLLHACTSAPGISSLMQACRRIADSSSRRRAAPRASLIRLI